MEIFVDGISSINFLNTSELLTNFWKLTSFSLLKLSTLKIAQQLKDKILVQEEKIRQKMSFLSIYSQF